MIVFLLIVFTVIVLLYIYSLKYVNPYKCTMIFGRPGSGKSTLLVKYALKYNKKGWSVFSTEHTPGTYYIAPEDIGFYQLPEKSLLLIDEAGTIFDNRNFKNFKPEVRDFFKLHRHYKVKVVLFSQTFDIDKKIRDITDEMFLITIAFRMFSYGRRIIRKIVLTKSEADRPSTISEDLRFDSILWFWCGSRFFTYVPKYIKYFNSFDAPELERKEYEYVTLNNIRERKSFPIVFKKIKIPKKISFTWLRKFLKK